GRYRKQPELVLAGQPVRKLRTVRQRRTVKNQRAGPCPGYGPESGQIVIGDRRPGKTAGPEFAPGAMKIQLKSLSILPAAHGTDTALPFLRGAGQVLTDRHDHLPEPAAPQAGFPRPVLHGKWRGLQFH